MSMPAAESSDQFFLKVDDEQYDELTLLVGMPVIHAAVWEDSLADALAAEPDPAATTVDLDLYLRDGIYFELYGVACYPSLDADPLDGRAAVERALLHGRKDEFVLADIAVDDEDALVLVLAQQEQPVLYLQVGAWLLDEWQELPDDAAS